MTKEKYIEMRNALMASAQGLIDSGDTDGASAKMTEIEKLDADYDNAAKAQANLNAMQQQKIANGITVSGMMNSNDGSSYTSKADMYNSEDYRSAFMRNVLTGAAIPRKFANSDAQTTTGEVASVIPTVLIQKIYSKLENVGKFFGLATKTNYKGGVTVPTSALNLTASWVAERSTADAQEATTGSITFSYYKLICKVAVSFAADIVTLDIFEADFVDKMAKAMTKAIEQAMFTGSGSAGNQMTGFLTETVASGQNVNITEGNHIAYADLAAAEAALPDEYDEGAIWVMPKKTYFNEIVGMIDSTGQPIARVNVGIDGKPEYTILGRHVEFSPYMPAFATSVTADTIVAAIFDFSSYVINTNYAMTVKKYTDEATDDQITKALMLVDGKTVDKNSLVTVTVKNS